MNFDDLELILIARRGLVSYLNLYLLILYFKNFDHFDLELSRLYEIFELDFHPKMRNLYPDYYLQILISVALVF